MVNAVDEKQTFALRSNDWGAGVGGAAVARLRNLVLLLLVLRLLVQLGDWSSRRPPVLLSCR